MCDHGYSFGNSFGFLWRVARGIFVWTSTHLVSFNVLRVDQCGLALVYRIFHKAWLLCLRFLLVYILDHKDNSSSIHFKVQNRPYNAYYEHS